MNRIENQCVMCDKMATGEILDLYMIDMLDVCDDCYKEVFQEVANEGKEYFHEWAVEMFDYDRANSLTAMIYGSTVETEPEETIMMFTYGILKYRHNLEREGALSIVENCTVKGHKMHLYNCSFPITRKTNDNDVIYGTLFEIPKSVVLYNYDFIEGYDSTRPAIENMYNREEVEVITPSGEVVKAQMYFANPYQFEGYLNNYTLIPTGNFDDKHLSQSYYRYTVSYRDKKNSKKGGK